MPIPQEELDSFKTWLVRYGRAPDTAAQYARNVRRAFEEEDPLDKLTDRDLSPKYLHLIKASLKAYSEFSGDSDLLLEVQKVRLPASRRRRGGVALSRDEWIALREEIDEWDRLKEPMRAELGMLVCRGFRSGDVLRLKRKEVTRALKKGVLEYEGKGRKRLQFAVSDNWKPYLEIFADHDKWERVEDLISPGAKEGPTRRKAAGKAVARKLEKCGERIGLDPEDLHPHLLRKTYATLYYDKCRDPEMLRQHMQWASVEVAMGYVKERSQKELNAIADELFD